MSFNVLSIACESYSDMKVLKGPKTVQMCIDEKRIRKGKNRKIPACVLVFL